MIILSDTTISGVYGDVTFVDGVAVFTMRNGERKHISGLPAGVRFSVSEPNAAQDGFDVVASGDRGEIVGGSTLDCVFVNAAVDDNVPQTRDDSHIVLWLLLLMVSGCGVSIGVKTRRSRQK